MGKILYPVGTPVTLRKYPEIEGLIVTRYVKGEKYPYRVGFHAGDEVHTMDGKSKFSKAGLKRSNPTQAKVDQGNAPKQPKSSACNCYTAEEVDVLLARQWEAVVQMLSNVDGVAMEALRNTHMIADMTDSNFRKVAKQFKTLNHDDD